MQAAKTGRWAIAAFFTTNGFIMGAWAPQIPLLLPRHSITESQLGLLILVLGLGAVGAMLFAGRLIAAYGVRRVVIVFSAATIPMLPAVVFAPNIPVLAVLMALMGAFIGCMDVAMNANAIEVERALGRAIMSSSHGFWSLGGFVGGIGGSYMIAHFGAETQALVVAGVAAVLVFGAMSFLMPDAPSAPKPSAEAAAPKTALVTRDMGLWLLGIMALLSMVPEGAVLDWAAIYLSKELGSDLFRAGLAFAFFAGAMAVMRFAGDAVRNRFGAVKTMRISALLAAAGLMGGAVAPTDIAAIAAFALAGVGIANMVPILFSAAGNYPGLPAGMAISTVTMVGYAGILVAPATIGFVAEHVGYRQTYAALALLLVFVAAMAGRTAIADDLRKT